MTDAIEAAAAAISHWHGLRHLAKDIRALANLSGPERLREGHRIYGIIEFETSFQTHDECELLMTALDALDEFSVLREEPQP